MLVDDPPTAASCGAGAPLEPAWKTGAMPADEHVIVIGGGLAAARAVESLRESGWDDRITIVAEEDRLPYERPPLSKGYLAGAEEASATIVADDHWYADHGVELRLGAAATAIRTDARVVGLADGELHYSRLLIATGARARRFTGRGSGLTGVHHLRTLDDSSALREAIRNGGRRVVVLGAGWIGLETAAVARGYGNEVTVVGRNAVPLASAIGPELGAVFADLHRENGVNLRMGSTLDGVRGDDGVEAVRLDSGEELPADVLIVGIGAVPNTELAASAGLVVDNGIATDAGFRTSVPQVWAAGDVASAFHPVLGHRIRVEHWANALNAGSAAGRAIAGQEVEYDEIPYFYTDQFDLGMEYSGYGEPADGSDIVIRGDLAGREFIAFWVAGERVIAGMNVNVWDVNETVQALIRSRVPADRARLSDPDVPLESLLGDTR
jgi:3-phenylpropionate/trans-cinnamate dioxygenase ferredoxin reductase component